MPGHILNSRRQLNHTKQNPSPRGHEVGATDISTTACRELHEGREAPACHGVERHPRELSVEAEAWDRQDAASQAWQGEKNKNQDPPEKGMGSRREV